MHHFRLRLTTAGRAAIADGANRGVFAVRFTRMSVGSGSGPGGAADDGRTALRSERDSASVTGSSAVAGEIAVCAEITPSADYAVTEVGLWGRRLSVDLSDKLYAYWTDPAEVFDQALNGGRLVVAGAMQVAASAADVTVAPDVGVTLESQGLLPLWLLPQPHANTADHRLAVASAAATAGGTVSVSAAQKLSLARVSGDTGFVRAVTASAWASGDLVANSEYYLRAQLAADGSLTLYVQRGTGSDAAPASRRGTPNASSGGGFPSTPLDARIAKVTTGAAGTVPTVVRYTLNARPRAGIGTWSAVEDYPHPSLAWGGDKKRYRTVAASGPAFGGPVDPTTDADDSHWTLDTPGAATATSRGTVELATDAEAKAGTDSERAVTPASMAAATLPSGVPAAGSADKFYVVKRSSTGNGGGLSYAEAVFRRYVTPGSHNFTVPAGVTRLRVTLVGAGGGGAGSRSCGEEDVQGPNGEFSEFVGCNPGRPGGAGGASSIRRGSVDLATAAGGAGGSGSADDNAGSPSAHAGYGAGGRGAPIPTEGNLGYQRLGAGGGAGSVSASTIAVVPGETLSVVVGGAGAGGRRGSEYVRWDTVFLGGAGSPGGSGFAQIVNG